MASPDEAAIRTAALTGQKWPHWLRGAADAKRTPMGISVRHQIVLGTVLFLMIGVPIIALVVIWLRQRNKS
jgi:hypothetical protein